MIPQIGFSEMLLLGILALVVLGPKDLPLMMRKFGRITGKLRMMAFEFQQSFDELGRQAELDELRKEVEALKKDSGIDDIQKEFEQTDADIAKDAGEAVNDMKADFEEDHDTMIDDDSDYSGETTPDDDLTHEDLAESEKIADQAKNSQKVKGDAAS